MAKSFGTQGIFVNEDTLREDWTPSSLPERESELDDLHDALAPASRGSTAHNVFLYGKTGQGKTAATNVKLGELSDWAEDEGNIDLTVIRLSCEAITSSYTCACKLVEEMSGENPNGHTQRTVFDMMYEEFENIGGTIIVMLDEIDNMGTSDDILYSIPRARSKGYLDEARVSLIGISNDFNYVDNLSPKVKDTLCEEEIEFAPYNANQLRQILERRVEAAFVDDVVEDSVTALCAAYAAKDKGSARQAIRYLYKAGELASGRDSETVTDKHVNEAKDTLERRRIEEGMRNVTPQDCFALTSVTALQCRDDTPVRTKEAYTEYRKICKQIDSDPLVQRRFYDHLRDLSMQGFLDVQKRDSGLKGGEHYLFNLAVDLSTTLDVLEENDRLTNENLIGNMRYDARQSQSL